MGRGGKEVALSQGLYCTFVKDDGTRVNRCISVSVWMFLSYHLCPSFQGTDIMGRGGCRRYIRLAIKSEIGEGYVN